MKLLTQLRAWRKKQALKDAKGQLEGRPSPFREGSPEKAQSTSGGPNDVRWIP